MKKLLMMAFVMCMAVNLFAEGKETPEQKAERMEWFSEARFGMFIHWGLYAVPAGEWDGKTNHGEWIMESGKIKTSDYAKFVQQFNPVKFDARAWVKAAKAAGMKYIVITSKHHDGFCLWPTKLNSDWNIAATPFKRDPLKELSDACKKEGLTFCLYHSIMDWHHTDYFERRAWNDTATGTPDMDKYVEYLKGQLKEIVEAYDPGILWFDGEWENSWTVERGDDLCKYLRELSPNMIINNRIGKGRGGMSGMDAKGKGAGDYGTPEQEIPEAGFGPGVYWESCMTMNNHWGYNKVDNKWKSAKTLVYNLVDCASKGGNYLLNVGPTAEGLIPQESLDRMAEMGRWMEVNGEAVYKTSANPLGKLAGAKCTRRGNIIYLTIFDWPKDGKIVVPVVNKVKKAVMLADGSELEVSDSDLGKIIALPAEAPDKLATVIKITIKGDLEIKQAAGGK